VVGFGRAPRRGRPVDDRGPVRAEQDVAGVVVAMAETIAVGQPVQDPLGEVPQMRRQDGVVDTGRQNLAQVRKLAGCCDAVDGTVCCGERTGQNQHPPRPALQERQHVGSVEALQHQADTAVAVHDVEQARRDAGAVQ
jgi:hypothetical protein